MSKRIYQKAFKRVETKYLIRTERLAGFLAALDQYVVADDFASSTISSLYFDTNDFAMIQDSLAKKHGKEKIRLRTYDEDPSLDSPVFLELKQKINGVGYKYRVATTYLEALSQIEQPDKYNPADQQLFHQLSVLGQRYGRIEPQMLIRYKRRSFKGRQDKMVRLTLDSDITYCPSQGLDTKGSAFSLLPPHYLMLEVKVADEMPTWLADLLNQHGLETVSFSKYGRAYQLHQAVMAEVGYA